MARVLIIDDDASVREALSACVEEAGHTLLATATAGDGLKAAGKESFDIVLLDLGLPDRHGLEVLGDLRKSKPSTPVIVISGESDMSSTVCAMRDGAFDFISKPFDPDVLGQHLERALRVSAGRAKATPVTTAADTADKSTFELIGNSEVMREVYKQLGLLSASRATVLIRGESGTGKELAARILHEFARGTIGTTAPFVAVNCAALPGPLVEAELFGYRRGAFTGADKDRAGKLEAAGDGTLFLDEVGEIPLEVQVKLLRVLQERQYERLGEPESRPFKARIVAATHRSLESLVKAGRFREDLYYRLNVASVTLPPLRERLEDLALVADRLLIQIAKELGRGISGLSAGAVAALRSHRWPGNVRELRNVLTRAAVKSRGHVLLEEDLELGTVANELASPEGTPTPGGPGTAGQEPRSRAPIPTLEDAESELVRRALDYTQGHRGNACALLGISRPTLLRKMRLYKLEVENKSTKLDNSAAS